MSNEASRLASVGTVSDAIVARVLIPYFFTLQRYYGARRSRSRALARRRFMRRSALRFCLLRRSRASLRSSISCSARARRRANRARVRGAPNDVVEKRRARRRHLVKVALALEQKVFERRERNDGGQAKERRVRRRVLGAKIDVAVRLVAHIGVLEHLEPDHGALPALDL